MLTYVLTTQICLLLVSLLLKTAFWPLRRTAVLAGVYAVIILLLSSTLFDLSRTTVDTVLSDRSLRLDWTILVTLEAMLMIAYCFTEGKWQRVLSFYPGLLALPAFYYMQMQVVFSQAGLSFSLFGWWSALAVVLFILGGSVLVRKAMGNQVTCHELLFITNLLLVVLCIIFAGII